MPDLRKCFDTIPHGLIMRGVEERVSDGTLLNVIRLFLKQGVMQTGDGQAWGTPNLRRELLKVRS